jgi:hypothetical protein
MNVLMNNDAGSNAARVCARMQQGCMSARGLEIECTRCRFECTRVQVRMHEGLRSNAQWCVLECSEYVDSNAREYVFDARSVGSSARICGLKLYEAKECGWAGMHGV